MSNTPLTVTIDTNYLTWLVNELRQFSKQIEPSYTIASIKNIDVNKDLNPNYYQIEISSLVQILLNDSRF